MKTIRHVVPVLALLMATSTARAEADRHVHNQPAADAAHWMAPEQEAKRSNPVKADGGSRARGKALFGKHCASCHGAEGRGDGPAGGALRPRPTDLAAMAGQHPDGDFAWKIANGRGAMPAWKGVLKEQQIWDVVNHIQGLAPHGTPGHGDHRHGH